MQSWLKCVSIIRSYGFSIVRLAKVEKKVGKTPVLLFSLSTILSLTPSCHQFLLRFGGYFMFSQTL